MNYTWSGVDLVELANKYEQSIYVYNLNELDERISKLNSLEKIYKNIKISYASKAFLNLAFANYISSNTNFGMDAVSIGEIFVQVNGGMDPKKILFHGNNKEKYEIEQALDLGIVNFAVDGLDEYKLLKQIMISRTEKIQIILRIAPSLENIKTHKFITTAAKDTKFGIPINTNRIGEIIIDSLNIENIELIGYHFHIGSQLLTNESHLKALDILLQLVEKYYQEYNFIPTYLNVGGGFGVTYTDEKEVDVIEFMKPIFKTVTTFFTNKNWTLPTICIEPGRWLVAPCGVTLYKVGNIKEIENVRTYVSVNGGMNDNLRVSLYGAKYDAIVANKMEYTCDKLVTIAGKNCESSDILIKDILVPNTIERGDIILVKTTGAYHKSMANNYNNLLIPAVIFIKNGQWYEVTRPQKLKDLVSFDLNPLIK